MTQVPSAPARADDRPRPVVPPYLFPIAMLVVGLVLDRLVRLGAPPRALALPLGALGVLLGAFFIGSGGRLFVRAGTSPNPRRTATALVTDGIFRRTRNPMYLGVVLVYLGIALLIGSPWSVVLVIGVVAGLHFGVILREERSLAARFGDEYRAYCARVRRWL